jgi:hypothetical protein
MTPERSLRKKLRKIEALFADTATEGEKIAAGTAADRIRDRLGQVAGKEKPIEIKLSISDTGIDTLTAAVGRNAPHHGSGCKAALPPDYKRLGPKRLEDAARKEMALDVEGVVDSGVDRQEALGGSRGLEPLLFSLSSSNGLM